MRFLSVCSGIEAASVAWAPLGWKAWALSEIEPFPCSVLAHHYPDTPNLGDMTKFKDWPDGAIDLLCGGTPCQSFSAAGLRAGLDDPRGQLMLTFGAIAARYRPRWLVWENVPGVLSSNGGRDFGAFLGLLGRLGYGFAYRVLDAQFVRVDGYARAVPQRRQRVFVVGCLGDWRSAAAVLLERESLRGDPAPRRSSGARVAACLTRGAESSGRGGYAGRRQEDDINIVAGTLNAGMSRRSAEDPERGLYVAGSLAGNGPGAGWRIGPDEAAGHHLVAATLDASYGRLQGASGQDANHGHSRLVAFCLNAKGGGGRLDGESETLIPTTGAGFDAALPFDTTQLTSATNRSNPQPSDPCHPLAAGAHAPAIAFQERGREGGRSLEIGGDVAYALTAPAAGGRAQERNIATGAAVRRLMPVECERLQGFPDGYTRIPVRAFKQKRVTKLWPEESWSPMPDGRWMLHAADGPRYKALGNSWAIPPVRWIGLRIAMVDGLQTMRRAA